MTGYRFTPYGDYNPDGPKDLFHVGDTVTVRLDDASPKEAEVMQVEVSGEAVTYYVRTRPTAHWIPVRADRVS